jgi:hypothetical protein
MLDIYPVNMLRNLLLELSYFWESLISLDIFKTILKVSYLLFNYNFNIYIFNLI